MKLTTLLLFITLSVSGQAYEPIIWVDYGTKQSETVRSDTTKGFIVYANAYRVLVEKGCKITQIAASLSPVPCPDGRRGCSVYHHGMVETVLSTEYITNIGEAVEEKRLIKFIEE